MRIHDVTDDVSGSQSRLNLGIDISPSIVELERRSKAQNIGMIMVIFLVPSISSITSEKKACRELKMEAILKY